MASKSSRLRCVVLDDYQAIASQVAPWDRLADRVAVYFVHESIRDQERLIALLDTADIIVANRERTRITAEIIAALPQLKLMVTTGMGNAAIDGRALRERGIPMCGTGNTGAPTVELTWALILSLARNIVVEANGLAAGRWQQTVGMGLEGRTLGVVGLGAVGSGVAKIGVAFGMEVLAWSPSLTPERAQAAGLKMAPDLKTLFACADIVSLHARLTTESRGLVGRDLLYAMKTGSFLINTARAALVDEAALLDVLRQKRIAGAALDVFETEPLPTDHPFKELKNMLLTPHLGYVTRQNYERYFGDAVDDILAWLDGSPIRVIN